MGLANHKGDRYTMENITTEIHPFCFGGAKLSLGRPGLIGML